MELKEHYYYLIVGSGLYGLTWNKLAQSFGKDVLIIEDIIDSRYFAYFIDEKIDKLLKLSQYGLPVKLQLSALANANPMKERGMSYIENALGLAKTQWCSPLVSSNVQSGNIENGDGSEGRSPLENPEDLTDEGEKSRDLDRNKK